MFIKVCWFLKKEMTKIQRKVKIDYDLIEQMKSSLEDLKNGRFKRLA